MIAITCKSVLRGIISSDIEDCISKSMIQTVLVSMAPVQKAEQLPIDGKDIQRVLTIGPGKIVGDILKWLKDKKFEIEKDGKEMTKDLAESLIIERYRRGPV